MISRMWPYLIPPKEMALNHRAKDGGSIKLTNETNNDAEHMALLGCLRLYKEKNLQMIDMEGDLVNVIRSIALGSTPSWKSQMWVEGILEILKGMDGIIKHVFREINKEVDFFSNHVIDQKDKAIISDYIDSWAGLSHIIATGN
ncbi:hypothetical protein SUGI_0193450 [Cryptomeria japonica]|nr:hypothetical protein SUGI_0193450 [Cryptomeria japonica]